MGDTQCEVPLSTFRDLKHLFHVTQASRLLRILRGGLQGMGRLGPTLSIFPIWDERSLLGPKFGAKLGCDIMLVFAARDVDIAVGLVGGALYASRDGTVSSSVTIPCAETLSQMIVLGKRARRRFE